MANLTQGPPDVHEGWIDVQVFWAPAQGPAQLRSVRLPAGANLADAVVASGLDASLPNASWREPGGELRLAVHGVLRQADAILRGGERVDITRALKVDPKEARRQRAHTSGRAVVRGAARRG
ncbi:MAG: RnfH family protein [Betaproteobacteria bacterium]|nr:RnfH family protein [Betaproteobacteria bacterium]